MFRPTLVIRGAILLGIVFVGGSGAPAPAVRKASPFPLRISSNARYLEDRQGRPFLINGDTPWSLTHNLTLEEAVRYMEDRAARGINALIISAPDAYARDGSHPDPPDRYGHQPFLDGDVTRPNREYWTHVARVLSRAEELGLLVLFFPAYLGCCEDGYLKLLQENGAERAEDYGRWIGRLLAQRHNLIWVHGGDRKPDGVEQIVKAVRKGIEESDPGKLHTVHWAPEADPWVPFGEAWIDLYTAYTYGPVSARVQALYGHLPVKPVLLIETHYENDFGKKTSADTRKYPYRAVLSGAAGHFFGNRPLWFCGFGWEAELASPGSRFVELAGRLFRSRPWQKLEPDRERRLIVAGTGAPATDDGAQAVFSREAGLALVYLPGSHPLTIDLQVISDGSVRGWWFDPGSGEASDAGIHPAETQPVFRPPRNGDWVLALEDTARGYPALGHVHE